MVRTCYVSRAFTFCIFCLLFSFLALKISWLVICTLSRVYILFVENIPVEGSGKISDWETLLKTTEAACRCLSLLGDKSVVLQLVEEAVCDQLVSYLKVPAFITWFLFTINNIVHEICYLIPLASFKCACFAEIWTASPKCMRNAAGDFSIGFQTLETLRGKH